MRVRIVAPAFSTSRCQAAPSVTTRSTRPCKLTVVTLANAGPTAKRQANSTFSGVRGAWLTTRVMAAGRSWETGTMGIGSGANRGVVYGMQLPRVMLASASPRRAELLACAGITCDVMPADVDERRLAGEPADAYCTRLALAKATAVAGRAKGRVCLGADTIVVVDDDVFGKPLDGGDASRMLRRLSGRRHEVLTAVAVVAGAGVAATLERTTVEFSALGEEEIAWYVASGEPMDKAGAYAIQGLASRFVTRIEGSYSNVVGLPVAAVYRLLRDVDPR